MRSAYQRFSAAVKSTSSLHEASSWARVAGYSWCSRRCASIFLRSGFAAAGASARATPAGAAAAAVTRESPRTMLRSVLVMVRMFFLLCLGSVDWLEEDPRSSALTGVTLLPYRLSARCHQRGKWAPSLTGRGESPVRPPASPAQTCGILASRRETRTARGAAARRAGGRPSGTRAAPARVEEDARVARVPGRDGAPGAARASVHVALGGAR